jgi:hypothetical protein
MCGAEAPRRLKPAPPSSPAVSEMRRSWLQRKNQNLQKAGHAIFVFGKWGSFGLNSAGCVLRWGFVVFDFRHSGVILWVG